MPDMDYAKGVDTGRYAGAVNVANASGLVSQKRSRTIVVSVPADAAANTNFAEAVIHQVPNWAGAGGAKITDIRVTATGNIAAQGATNFAVIKVQVRDDTGTVVNTAGILNLAVTPLTNFISARMTFTNNSLVVLPLGKITLRTDKTGANPPTLVAYSVLFVVEDT